MLTAGRQGKKLEFCGQFSFFTDESYRLMEPYCNILHTLLRTDSNRELLRETSLVPELTVAKKMLKNNNAIQQKIDRILAITA